MQHQRTELPTNRHNKKGRPTGRPKQYKATEKATANQVKKSYDTGSHIELLTIATNVVTPYMCKDSNALQRSTNVKCSTNMVTSPVYVNKRNLKCIIRIVTETLKCTNYMQVPCMHKTVPITIILKNPSLMNHFVYSYKHKAIRLKVSIYHNLFI